MKNYWNYWPNLLFPQEIKPNLNGKKSIGDLGPQQIKSTGDSWQEIKPVLAFSSLLP
jgi:hypothetical protein